MMRRSNVLPALAASGFAMAAVLAGAAFAQTAAPAPSAAEATADALKKAATGVVAKPAAPIPATAAPAADTAAAAKPSVPAKAKETLPWNKPKAPKAATAGDAAPAEALKADAAAATTTAKAAPKAASAGTPVKGANGEVMSGPMAATHAFFGAGTYAAPAPSKTAVRAGCTRLAHSSIDVGKENPIKFSREGIDNQIAALTKTKGWKATSKSDEKIICTEYVNLGLFGQEYTCRVETTVCPK